MNFRLTTRYLYLYFYLCCLLIGGIACSEPSKDISSNLEGDNISDIVDTTSFCTGYFSIAYPKKQWKVSVNDEQEEGCRILLQEHGNWETTITYTLTVGLSYGASTYFRHLEAELRAATLVQDIEKELEGEFSQLKGFQYKLINLTTDEGEKRIIITGFQKIGEDKALILQLETQDKLGTEAFQLFEQAVQNCYLE